MTTLLVGKKHVNYIPVLHELWNGSASFIALDKYKFSQSTSSLLDWLTYITYFKIGTIDQYNSMVKLIVTEIRSEYPDFLVLGYLREQSDYYIWDEDYEH